MSTVDLLNKMKYPIHKVELPSGKTVSFRPWTVNESKILMMADTSGDGIEIQAAIEQVMQNCLLDADKNVREMFTYDLDFLFLKVRSRSSGEKINIILTYENKDKGIPKQMKTVEVDLSEVKPFVPSNRESKIMLDEHTGIVLRDPKVKDVDFCLAYKAKNQKADYDFLIAARCIEQIFSGEEAGDASEVEFSQLVEFVSGLLPKQYKKIEDFFDTIPHLKHELQLSDYFPGATGVHTIEGLKDFFG